MQRPFTWKELVARALRDLGGEATLQNIYRSLGNCPQRPQTTTWQATVRRVLRQYKIFEPTRSGEGLAAYRIAASPPLQPLDSISIDDPHGEQQGMLLQLGRICGYETYTNSTDKTIRRMGGIGISQFATVRNDPESLRNLPLERIRNVDVLWMAEDDQGLYPRYAFEVEQSTKVKSGMLRLLKIPLRYRTVLYVIGRDKDEANLFSRYVSQSPFREHASRIGFKFFGDVRSFYHHAVGFTEARVTFGVMVNEN
jgi:hypothetical protein